MLTAQIKRLKLKDTWTISRSSDDFKDNVFIRLEKDGVTGIGEAAPNFRYGENAELTIKRVEQVRPILEKTDWRNFGDVKSALDEAITDQSCAKCGIDSAIMDWIGKKYKVPYFRLIGANPAATPKTSYSIGIDSVENMQRKIREAEPYPILKIKLGKDNDEEIMNAVREVTDKTVRVDANEGWKDRQLAAEKIQWLKTLGVEFVEQPMPADQLDDMIWLKERSALPLVADESVKNASDILKLAGAFHGINIKLMKSGGPQEGLRMIAMARALDLKIMLGCMIESSLAITTAAQLSPYVDWADLDGNLLISNDPYRGMTVQDGKMNLPEGPGLGVSDK